MYKVALCEDEKVFSAAQEKICRRILDKLNTEYQIAMFENSRDFLEAFEEGAQRYDLILLDIVMDGMSGMELARTIRRTDREAVIIFITSRQEYALQGYDVSALHYLMKPVDAEVLERLIVSAHNDRFKNKFFIFKSGGQNLRIPIKDIIALETIGRKVIITLPDATYSYPGKLAEMLDVLPKDRFVRCHRAFAVNVGNIRELTRQDAIAVNGSKIPVSRTFLKDVQTAFLKHMQEV